MTSGCSGPAATKMPCWMRTHLIRRALTLPSRQAPLCERRSRTSGVYATSAAAVVKALEVVEAEAIRRIDPWLLGAAPYLRGPIARASRSPAVTRNAAELLLRELARDRRLLTLGLLTAEYEPYLGLYAPEDADEVSRQVDALAQALADRGYVRSRDLPAPRRPREANAWRSLILRHGEFLGWGTLDGGVLRSWECVVAG